MLLKAVSATLLLTIGSIAAPTAAQAPPPANSVRRELPPLRSVPRGLRGEPAIPTAAPLAPAHRVPADPAQRCPKFETAIARHGLKPVATFSYIAYRESRCRIKAINGRWDRHGNLVWTLNANGTIDRGLFQVNSSWRSVTRKVCGGSLDSLLILDCNLKVAKYLLDHGGLAHWGM